MTVQDWLDEATTQLQNATSSPRLDAELLLANVLNTKRATLLSDTHHQLSATQRRQLTADLQRRLNGEPLAYIIGTIEFYGLQLSVDTRVLCPRPDTETLVERAVQAIPEGLSVIDVGTGSGAIALALKTNRPDLNVVAADVSTAALAVAQQNIEQLHLDIKAVQSDLLSNVESVDVVIANLPYLPDREPLDPSVKHEPALALLGGSDGLDYYRQLFAQLDQHQQTKHVFIEAEIDQKQELITIANSGRFTLHWCNDYSYQFER